MTAKRNKLYSILVFLLLIYWILLKCFHREEGHHHYSSIRVSKMAQRRNWIKDNCRNCGKVQGSIFLGRQGLNFSVQQFIRGRNFIGEEKTKTIYCFAHKVATSSMFYIYSHIYNDTKFFQEIKNKTRLYFSIKYILNLSSKEVRRLSYSHYTYLIHRHPYERLISGYIDRIINNRCSYQAKETYQKIYLKKLRHRCIPKIPSFVKFIRLIIKQGKRHPDLLNDHWRPIYRLCSPCLINYDGIFKINELDELLRESGIDKTFPRKMLKLNMRNETDFQQTIRSYYSQLTCADLEQLRRIYEMDFRLFQYDDKKYRMMCQDLHQ